MPDPWLTICIQCHFFQRRLAWMLSSLFQQPGVAVDVAMMEGNGRPETEQITRYFRTCGMVIRDSIWLDYGEFQFRGLTRNRQLWGITTPWVLWADADMVYSPSFFARLGELVQRDYQDYDGILSAGRLSNPLGQADTLVNGTRDGIPYVYVLSAWDRASALTPIKRRNCGAGYFQLVRAEVCGGYYVNSHECRDHGWTGTFSKCRSDQQFRRRIGKLTKLPEWFSQNQIHLNHDRDNLHGAHIEAQR